MKTLGQRIRELREAKDISLREFAKKLGDLSPPFVSDIELGRRFPSEKVLEKIAHILEEPIEELRRYDSRPPIEELKRLSASDPTYGFALRKVVDGEISAEDLMKFANKKQKK
jgi:transcriptional regulator with XRE-family HTH domain